jgi:hypothetical protein
MGTVQETLWKVKEKTTCRLSGGPLIDLIDFGPLPVSAFPLPSDPKGEPLPLQLCLNRESGLVQLKHSVDPDQMYSQYWYMSGVNQSMKEALRSITEQALSRTRRPLQVGDIVVDIASNDGTLLCTYPEFLYRIGIDPAKNIQPQGANLHINTYFSAARYKEKMGERKAEIVTSIAMFYDLEDPIAFARDVASILVPGGLWVLELSYLPTMLERNSFDTVCAEHLEYYSLHAIEYILARAGLEAEDVELNEVNGGSFRVTIRHQGYARPSLALEAMRESEKKMELTSPAIYLAFAERVKANKREMIAFLSEQKRLGKKVLGYGASTKGNTILAYYGIGPDLISHIADRNPIKWGRQTITGIDIISEEEARSMRPDYFVAFPYHFMPEFLKREEAFLKRGGKFVSPIPSLKVFS